MIDWDDFRILLAVARTGSLSAAARELGVTQPTVGRRLARLEQRLGASLFVRTASGQSATTTGKRLIAAAERMEQDALSAERFASGRHEGLRGRVIVTASEWLVDRALAPLLPPFHGEHPGIELELLAEARHLNLIRREADIALRPSVFPHQDVVQTKLCPVGFGLYASDSYLAQYGTPNLGTQCAGHELIAMSEYMTRIPEATWLPSVTRAARVVARTNGRIPMLTLVEAGVGFACLPTFLAQAAPKLRRLPLDTDHLTRELFLGVHRDVRRVTRVRATAAFLKRSLQALSSSFAPSAS